MRPPSTLNYDALRRVAAAERLDPSTVRAIKKIISAAARSARFRRCVRDLAEIAEHDILADSSIRCTPAMAAGVTNTFWTVRDLVEMVEA